MKLTWGSVCYDLFSPLDRFFFGSALAVALNMSRDLLMALHCAQV